MSYFKIENLAFEYVKGSPVFSDVNIEMNKGGILAVCGASGAGKSTLLNIIAGFEQPTAGSITLDGKDITAVPVHKRNIGFIFQDYALFPHLTVEKNIAFGLKNTGGVSKSARIHELLTMVQLDGYEKRFPHELSGGQQQRIALVRSLATNPRMLLMDEPFSNLDHALKDELMRQLKDIFTALSITVLFVSHDTDDIQKIADTVYQIG